MYVAGDVFFRLNILKQCVCTGLKQVSKRCHRLGKTLVQYVLSLMNFIINNQESYQIHLYII